jgi:formylglycine-generating enzyme required for sulfatase activity
MGKVILPFILIFLMFLLFANHLISDEKANSIGMIFMQVEPGTFFMGDLKGESDERPLREVTISKPFYLGKFEVTQAEWTRVMGSNPSLFQGANRPVDSVSWDMAKEFIKRLNNREGTLKYRLPTEAEWEYAARAGTNSTFYFGNDSSLLGKYEWFKANSGNETHEVGQKSPNPWGFHDLLGNVAEWVEDYYGEFYYMESPAKVTDPKGPPVGVYRVIRGGSRHDDPFHCRPADRLENEPDFVFDMIRGSYGFRVAYSAQPIKKRLFGVTR